MSYLNLESSPPIIMPEKKPKLYSKKDIFVFDNIKALGIYFVFMAHMSHTTSYGAFIMAGFIFASGFSYKATDWLSYCTRCISCYIFANLLFGVAMIANRVARHEAIDWQSIAVGPNNALLWYLLCLIAWACMCQVFLRLRHPIIVALLLCPLIISIWYPEPPHNPKIPKDIIYLTTLGIAGGFVPFLLGVLIPWESIARLRHSKTKYYGIFISAVYFWFQPDLVILPTMLSSLCKILGNCACVLTLIAFMPGLKIKIITKIGQASLNIYVLHAFVIFCLITPIIHPAVTYITNNYISSYFETTSILPNCILICDFACAAIGCWGLSNIKFNVLISAVITKFEQFFFKPKSIA